MDRDTFVVHTSNLIREAQAARTAAKALGCDIDCQGFIADLINDYGTLILNTAWGSDDAPDKVWEEFWNLLINANAEPETIIGFYHKWIN